MINIFLSTFLLTILTGLVCVNSASASENNFFKCSGQIKKVVLNQLHLNANGHPRAEYIYELSEPVTTTNLTSNDKRFSYGVIKFNHGYKIVFTVFNENGVIKLAGHFRRESSLGHITVLSVGGNQDIYTSLNSTSSTVIFSSTEAINGYINEKTSLFDAVENGKLPSGVATDAWLSCI